MENKVSIEISPADLLAIKVALAVLQAKLGPLLIALTDEERRSLFKMGEASRPFVEKVLEYVVSNPEFLPPFTDVAEMQKDWKAISDLIPIFNGLSQLCSNLDDTLMEAGSEVMVPSAAYYKSAQMAAKLGVPSAKPVVADLRVRWERKPKKSPPKE
ncbi:hypothetical protein [Algoriphagus yeomjeoni]|uniref:Uncharacterized protein n=1 Tax=Algoriphagus yeomjeoni TaxID=291403 RepID=A0A327NX04_9BACT|nr:hypothetical protein [Algoriphagus yeomjeoni]RAI83871.1 hypothetical protein LV83_04185 [Algoriphagus yeomjeoni]